MPAFLRAMFAGLGTLAVIGALWSRWMNLRAGGWPRTRASILKSELLVDPQEGGTAADILYSFKVGAQEYRSDRILYTPRLETERWKRHLLKRFSKGAEVNVYYNPADPQQCVLIRSAGTTWAWGVVIGVAFIAAALLAP